MSIDDPLSTIYRDRIPTRAGEIQMSKSYERPQIREIGSVRDLTLQTLNKVGTTEDVFTVVTNGIVIGSVVNSP
jgi:hypothetical protein